MQGQRNFVFCNRSVLSYEVCNWRLEAMGIIKLCTRALMLRTSSIEMDSSVNVFARNNILHL